MATEVSLRSRRKLALAAGVVVFAVTFCTAPTALANLIVAVDRVGDQPDASPGDGICDSAPTVRGEQCTLRAAIEETNALPGSDAIRFAIPGTGVHTIKPASELPTVTGPLEINGYSQPGASPNTHDLSHPDNAELRIELDGENITQPRYGLYLAYQGAAPSLIRGLVINRFFGGIGTSFTQGGVTIRGDFIGTDPSGTVALPNAYNGIFVSVTTSGATIGGTDPADRNVISANGPMAGSAGIIANAPTSVRGNLIGTQADGTSPLPNNGDGLRLSGDAHVIGGGSGGANVVAFNTANGIALTGTEGGSTFTRNRIFGNGALGIDLNDDGVTPNDHLDGDTGPNELQNFPVLTKATTGAKATVIQGIMLSTPNTSFTVEFFDNPSGGHEGKRFIGQRTVSTGSGGGSTFAFRPAARVAVGNTITATATNSNGSTSEFSAPRTVTTP